MILSLLLAIQIIPPRAPEIVPIRHVRLLASSLRVWRPETDEQVVLVPIAVALDGIIARDSTARVPLELDIWNASGRHTQQEQLLSFRRASRHVQDYLVVPLLSNAVRLELTIDPGHRGTAGTWADTVDAILPDSVMLSDIVIGPATGTPRAFDEIALLPRLVVERGQLLEVFVQAWSARSWPGARVRLQVLRMQGPDQVPEAELSVAFDQPIGAGLNKIVKEIDSTRLPGGLYLYRYQVLAPGGELLAERERLLGFMDGVE